LLEWQTGDLFELTVPFSAACLLKPTALPSARPTHAVSRARREPREQLSNVATYADHWRAREHTQVRVRFLRHIYLDSDSFFHQWLCHR
jgi:hypothetical protein